MAGKNIEGKRFGRLIAIENVGKNKQGRMLWKCKCDCGNTIVTTITHLTTKQTLSCGCLRKEKVTRLNTKHGKTNTRLYKIWDSMKQRCYNHNAKNYKNYGGRGIKIYNKWLNDFESFYNWSMENGYKDTLSIDRIDGNKDYEPSNCKWSTRKEQNNNRRNNKLITYKGKTKTIAEWSNELGISYDVIKYRINKKWSIEDIFTIPVKRRKKM